MRSFRYAGGCLEFASPDGWDLHNDFGTLQRGDRDGRRKFAALGHC